MFTRRNVLALALFLFGTTFLWLSATWAGYSATGTIWTNVALHALGSVAMLVVLLVPPAHAWLLGRIGG